MIQESTGGDDAAGHLFHTQHVTDVTAASVRCLGPRGKLCIVRRSEGMGLARPQGSALTPTYQSRRRTSMPEPATVFYIADLREFRGPCFEGDDASSRDWTDCVSSVRVAPGWRATLYRGTNYDDDSLEITEDVANLQLVRQHDCDRGGLNDCVSSVRVRRQ